MSRHHPRDLRAIKVAFDTLMDLVGGVDAASAALGYSKSHLSDAASLHHPDRAPRLDHAAELELIAGRPLVTAQLARMAGCTLLPLPRAAGTAGAAIAEVLRGAGELGAEAAAALDDGTLTEAERAALAERLDTLARAAVQARAVLAQGKPAPLRVA
jgi:hypothetical protein